MFGIGLPELIVILVLALIVLGPEKLPVVAKQFARFMNDLKKATEEFKQEIELDKLDDIKNPVKLEDILGEDINRLRKDPAQRDFSGGDSRKQHPEPARDERRPDSDNSAVAPQEAFDPEKGEREQNDKEEWEDYSHLPHRGGSGE